MVSVIVKAPILPGFFKAFSGKSTSLRVGAALSPKRLGVRVPGECVVWGCLLQTLALGRCNDGADIQPNEKHREDTLPYSGPVCVCAVVVVCLCLCLCL